MSPATSAKKHRFPLTGFWWASFDWARSPYYYIVIIYVFSAYFAESVVGDSTRGQAIFSSIATVAGLIMAVAAPFLGGFMDRGGAKKPVLFALMLILDVPVVLTFCLQVNLCLVLMAHPNRLFHLTNLESIYY